MGRGHRCRPSPMDVFATHVSLKGEQMKSPSLHTASKTTRKRRSKLSEKQSQVLQTHAFKPGESGNIAGRPRKLMTEAYRRALERKFANDPQGRTYADAIAEKMIGLGLKGDVRAVAEVSTRADGVPQQSVSFDGDGSSLSIEIASMSPEQKRQRVAELLAKARGTENQ
jgi:hypothetical protein